MPRRLSIQEHLSVDELERNYRATYDPIERTRYQIIWLLAKGKTTLISFFSYRLLFGGHSSNCTSLQSAG